MEVKDKIIRKFKDIDNNEYAIYKQSNGHVRLVKFEDRAGKTILTRKFEIYNFVKEMWKNGKLKEETICQKIYKKQ